MNLKPQYLLLLGSPRSGTTLLSSMIAAHHDVAFLIEDTQFSIKKLTGKKVLGNKLCIPHQIDLNHRATYFTRLLKKVNLLKNYPISKFNIEDYLKLDNIKIIGIIRNGNDVIPSIMKRGAKNFNIALGRWCGAIQILFELNKKHKDKFVIISFEDLVSNPKPLLKNISRFIGIEFDQQMMEGHKYNILYPEQSGIDESKAYKYRSETNHLNIENEIPEIIDKYNFLYESRLNF